MAPQHPKRLKLDSKSKGKGKRTQGDGSSSGAGTAVFRNARCQQHYQEVASRQLVAERKVILSHVDFPAIIAALERRHWTEFATFLHRADLKLVREFYANAYDPNHEQPFMSEVRGRPVPFDAETINELLGIPTEFEDDRCEYERLPSGEAICDQVLAVCCVPNAEWECGTNGAKLKIMRSNLLPMGKLWAAFIHANVLPCSHESDVHITRTRLLYAIMSGKTVNLGGVLATNIRLMGNKTDSTALGHPCLITELIAKAGVEVTNERQVQRRTPIDYGYVMRECYGQRKGRRNHLGEEEQEHEPEQPQQPQRQRRPPTMEDMMHAMTINQEENRRMHSDQLRHFSSIRDLFREMRVAQGEGRPMVIPSEEELRAQYGWSDYPRDEAGAPAGGGDAAE